MGFGFNPPLDFKKSTFLLRSIVDEYCNSETSNVELADQDKEYITEQIQLFYDIRSKTKLNADVFYKPQLDNIFIKIKDIQKKSLGNYKYSDLVLIRAELNTLIFLIDHHKVDIAQDVTQKSSKSRFWENSWHWIKKHKITIAVSIAVVIGSIMTAGAVGAIAGGVWGGFALIGGGLGVSSIPASVALGVIVSAFAGVAIAPAVNKLKKIAKWAINGIISKSFSLYNAISDSFSKKTDSGAVIAPVLSSQPNSVGQISNGLGINPRVLLSNNATMEVPRVKKIEYRTRSFSLPIPKASLSEDGPRSQRAFSI